MIAGSKNLRKNSVHWNYGKKKLLDSISFSKLLYLGELRWETNFQRSKLFFDTHGKLPTRKEDAVLNGWLAKNREKLKNGILPDDKRIRFENAKIDLLAGTFTLSPWETRFEDLKNFIRAHNRRPLPNKKDLFENKLYVWCSIQKMSHRKGKLSSDKWNLLKDTCSFFLTYHTKTKSSSGKRPEKRESKELTDPINTWDKMWEKKFNEAIDFINKKGRMPAFADPNEKKLYSWISVQKTAHRKGKLPPEKWQRLNEIGISLARQSTPLKNPKKRASIKLATWTIIWENMFNEAKEFINKNGRLPLFADPNERKLYTWISVQKTAHRKGKLTPEKWQRLNEIGISLVRVPTPKFAEIFEARLKEAEKFFKKHGRLPTIKENQAVHRWVNNHRLKLKSNKLSPEIKRKFDEAGIDLKAVKVIHSPWHDKFAEVKNFITKKGRLPISRDVNEKKLYIWISKQKAAYRKGKLTTEKLKGLNDIGIYIQRIATPRYV